MVEARHKKSPVASSAVVPRPHRVLDFSRAHISRVCSADCTILFKTTIFNLTKQNKHTNKKKIVRRLPWCAVDERVALGGRRRKVPHALLVGGVGERQHRESAKERNHSRALSRHRCSLTKMRLFEKTRGTFNLSSDSTIKRERRATQRAPAQR